MIYYKEVAVLFDYRKKLEVEEFHSWRLKVTDIRNKADKTEIQTDIHATHIDLPV